MDQLLLNSMDNQPTTEQESRDVFIRKSQASPLIMARELMLDNPEIVRSEENIYRNNGKCYDLLSDKNLDELFCNFCNKYGADKAWKSVSSTIRAFLVFPEIKKVEKMNDYPNLINLANGVLDIKEKIFTPHPTKYYFDSIVNIDYLPEDKNCPLFLKFLNDIFNSDKDTMGNIIRLGGYLLDTSCKAERMFLFDGGGANGKSVLGKVFKMFFVKDQITPLGLDVIASGSFSKELLIKSRLNFSDEQKKSYLDSAEIKKMVTGDPMEINRKFKIPLSFEPKAKLIVNCNGIPAFNDTTHAIYRRMLLFKFNNSYLTQSDYDKLPSKNNCFLMDRDLFEKIEKEKSAILNLFIEGLVELRNNKYEFVESGNSLDAINNYKRDNDTVREFLEDTYKVNYDKKMSLRQIYEHFRWWHRRNVSDSSTFKFRINEMGKRLKEIFKIEPLGQEYIFNNETQKMERETMYPIEELSFQEPVEEQQVLSKEEVAEVEKELGLKFNN